MVPVKSLVILQQRSRKGGDSAQHIFSWPRKQCLDEVDLYCFENKVVLKAIFGLVLFIAALKNVISALKNLH